MANFINSSSPHVKSNTSTRSIMIEVCIALVPITIASIVLFGLSALWIILVATATAVLSEFVYLLLCKKTVKDFAKQFDFTSVVTGMLIGLNMPSGVELYVPVLASIFGIVVVKMLFGGTGRNIVNPAIAGRIFVFMSFSSMMIYATPNVEAFSGLITTGATNLQSVVGDATSTFSAWELLLGVGVAGVIGETCKIAIILGGIYLCVRGILNFRWPLVYMLTVGVVTVLINPIIVYDTTWAIAPIESISLNFDLFWQSILSGGLVLGAVFMATDYTTSPMTKTANYVYFAVMGILTAVLRQACGMEVVSFVILLMNLLVPLFDKYIRRKPFGYVAPAKSNKEVA